jgi:hypothetical protein
VSADPTALDRAEWHQTVAFLLLSVANDPDHAMEPFLQWCRAHSDQLRAMGQHPHTGEGVLP